MVVGLHFPQIIFSAIDEEKEGDCALPPEEGEGLQDAAAGRPGEPPSPSTSVKENFYSYGKMYNLCYVK